MLWRVLISILSLMILSKNYQVKCIKTNVKSNFGDISLRGHTCKKRTVYSFNPTARKHDRIHENYRKIDDKRHLLKLKEEGYHDLLYQISKYKILDHKLRQLRRAFRRAADDNVYDFFIEGLLDTCCYKRSTEDNCQRKRYGRTFNKNHFLAMMGHPAGSPNFVRPHFPHLRKYQGYNSKRKPFQQDNSDSSDQDNFCCLAIVINFLEPTINFPSPNSKAELSEFNNLLKKCDNVSKKGMVHQIRDYEKVSKSMDWVGGGEPHKAVPKRKSKQTMHKKQLMKPKFSAYMKFRKHPKRTKRNPNVCDSTKNAYISKANEILQDLSKLEKYFLNEKPKVAKICPAAVHRNEDEIEENAVESTLTSDDKVLNVHQDILNKISQLNKSMQKYKSCVRENLHQPSSDGFSEDAGDIYFPKQGFDNYNTASTTETSDPLNYRIK